MKSIRDKIQTPDPTLHFCRLRLKDTVDKGSNFIDDKRVITFFKGGLLAKVV